ncbi:Diphthine--ammonia ligase [Astathelohania contejeani]|uniref:Diphthine--ammonia ligase n=1 Tax=Astathelohania contejeani TaxID=164912 RepID=A0ABQ7HYR5_9MICR|nr:Diphthine--ammonia ligase [Thelohania contejeani]
MKFIGLISGGKDSVYSICKLIDKGDELVGLIYMSGKLLDSYMYQTVGMEIIKAYSDCFGVPLFEYNTNCKSINIELEYKETENDEVEDLYNAIKNTKEKLEFQGVSSGAILSQYQKNRVENVCKRLSLTSLSPLWNLDQITLLNEMIEYGIIASIVKIASPCLSLNCINYNLKELLIYLSNSSDTKYFNYCGEGGEYETLALDCPKFKKKIIINEYLVLQSPEDVGKRKDVGYMKIKKFSLIDKQ